MKAVQPFTPRAPRPWELQTFALMAVTAASAFVSFVLLLVYLGVFLSVATHGRSGTSVLVEKAIAHGGAIDGLYFFLVIGYVFGFAWWQRETARQLAAFRIDDPAVARHWSVPVWRFALVFSIVLRFAADSLYSSSDAATDRGQALWSIGTNTAGHALRVASLGILLYGVWIIRGQVRRAIAASGVAPTPRQLGLRRNLTPAAPLPSHGDASLATADIPPADDEFWSRVQALSAEQGGDLAVLESATAWVRRWLLLPAGAPLGAVRAAIPPGSVVTVFPSPPLPGADAPTEPPAAGPGTEWFGLLQDGGTLRYQLVRPARLPVWLAQARSSDRWALYRTDDPAALTAVMPSPLTSPTTPAASAAPTAPA
jgi:hypothetical protein